MTQSKKHHYVPQSLLRKFGYDDSKIYVYDKTRRVSFGSSILDAGSENHFNTVFRDGERVNFEHVFQKNDAFLAELVQILTTGKCFNDLTDQYKDKLLGVISTQIFRTKMYRTSILSIAEQLKFSLSEAGLPNEHLEAPSDNNIREIALSSYYKIQNDYTVLDRKVGFLIQSNVDNDFIISDNPVTKHNTFPYGDLGLSSSGVEIYFPLSPQLTFALYCPSIFEKMEVYVKTQAKSEVKDLYESILVGASSGHAVSLGEQTSKFLNTLQVKQSSRFLYSSDKSNFSIADLILSESPELANVESHTKVGKLGQAPEKNTRMPDGEWVVIHTDHDHFMLHVTGVFNDTKIFSFTTKSVEDTRLLLVLEPINEISLYIDGQQTTYMRDVKLEVEPTYKECAKFKVLHTLDILNNIV